MYQWYLHKWWLYYNTVDDGTECTDDGNECTNDICSNGICSHTPVDNEVECICENVYNDDSVECCTLSWW